MDAMGLECCFFGGGVAKDDIGGQDFWDWCVWNLGCSWITRVISIYIYHISALRGPIFYVQLILSQMLNVWPIYLHLGSFGGKCR